MKYSLRVRFCYVIICAYCHLVQSDTSHAHTDLLLIRIHVCKRNQQMTIDSHEYGLYSTLYMVAAVG